jgi:hypothetical protein
MDFFLEMFGFNFDDMIIDKIKDKFHEKVINEGMKYSSKFFLCNIKSMLYEVLDNYEKGEYMKNNPNNNDYEKYKENFYNGLVNQGILVPNGYKNCTIFGKNKEKEFNLYIDKLQEKTKNEMIEVFKFANEIQTDLVNQNKEKKAGKKMRKTIKNTTKLITTKRRNKRKTKNNRK